MSQRRTRTALIVGLGAVGGHLARHLALAGWKLVLCDGDTVAAHNVGVQPLYRRADVGQRKAHAARRSLRRMGAPGARAVAADVRGIGVGLALEVDLVAACVDNRGAEAVVAKLAFLAARPYLRLSTDPGRHIVDVLVVPAPAAASDPCGVCYLTGADMEIAEARVGCGDRFEGQQGNAEQGASIPSPQGALAGALAAELVGGALGPARLVRLESGARLGASQTRLVHNPTCRLGAPPFEHAAGRYTFVGRAAEIRAGDLVARAAHALGSSVMQVAVDLDTPYSDARHCLVCHEPRGPGFVRPDVAPCPRCASTRVSPALSASSRLPAATLSAAGGRTMAALDAPRGAGFRFTNGNAQIELCLRSR